MSDHPKILPQHRERQVYVYIRQSTPQQVEQHLESQDLQYQLVQRAQALGWPQGLVVVIDDDLGKSAVTTAGRQGFQRLVSAVGLFQVGLILVIEVSRLARNCGDWYRLLDLAALCGSLIGDATAVYDPRDYNDRLLLGLKGTLAEAQWYSMRERLGAARLNKARRGQLAMRLPIGYDRDEDGQVVLTPDQQVQGAIRLVFEQFERQGSGQGVLRYFRDQRLQLPRYRHGGPHPAAIEWLRPSYGAIYQLLKHPAYAGAYSYGKHRRVRLPDGRLLIRRLPMDEWAVLIPGAFPAYISWEQFLRNQRQLQQNAQGSHWTQGAPRQGQVLLAGLVICGRCGRPLHARYGGRRPAYACYHAHDRYGAPRCQHFTARHVDEAVVQVFLEAVRPARLEVALAAVEQVEVQQQALAAQWQKRLERARYETELARRRYEQVDPDNRLVAAELERHWEQKLQALADLQGECRQAQQRDFAPLSEQDKALIRHLAEDLPALWQATTTTSAERKRLLRCLIQDVTLDRFSKPGVTIIHIRWHTGTTTTIEVERPQPGCWTPPVALRRIQELAPHHPDDHIASLLNEEGLRTGKGLAWTRKRVEKVRKRRGIETGCPCRPRQGNPRGDGLVSAQEAAEKLGISSSTVSYWFKAGILGGRQRKPNSMLWIGLTQPDRQRLDGSASSRPDLVPIAEAAARLGMTTAEVWAQVRAGRLTPYRLRIKNRWLWHTGLSDEPVIPTEESCEVHCV